MQGRLLVTRLAFHGCRLVRVAIVEFDEIYFTQVQQIRRDLSRKIQGIQQIQVTPVEQGVGRFMPPNQANCYGGIFAGGLYQKPEARDKKPEINGRRHAPARPYFTLWF
jgi:hypothetical protein